MLCGTFMISTEWFDDVHVHRFMNFNTKCFAVHELFRNNDKRSDKN